MLTLKESVVKIVAIQVVLLSILSIFIKPLLIFLMIDFATRSFFGPKYSLLARLGKLISNLLKLDEKMIPAKPKMFAASIGLIIVSLAIIFTVAYLPITYILLIVLTLFSSLEGFFGFCVGCKLYWLMIKLF